MSDQNFDRVDTVMATLKEVPEPVIQLLSGLLSCLLLAIGVEGLVSIACCPDAADFCVLVAYPSVQDRRFETAPVFREEAGEQVLDGGEFEDVLSLHHLYGGHPPPPIRVRVLFQNCPDGNPDLVKELGQSDARLPALLRCIV
jgi:hypothetical protein